MINKNKFSIKDTKKVLHKVGKRWVVVSAVLLGLAAGGAAVTTANADTTAQAAQPQAAVQANHETAAEKAAANSAAAQPAHTARLGAELGDAAPATNTPAGMKSEAKAKAKDWLQQHNLPTNKQAAKAKIEGYASDADVTNLAKLANTVRGKSAASAYSNLFTLANNAASNYSRTPLGNRPVVNSSADTVFGMFKNASNDINTLDHNQANGPVAQSYLDKASNAMSKVNSFANEPTFNSSNVGSTVSAEMPVPDEISYGSTKKGFSMPFSSTVANPLGMGPSITAKGNISLGSGALPLGSTGFFTTPSVSLNANISIPNPIDSSIDINSTVNSVADVFSKEASNSIDSSATSYVEKHYTSTLTSGIDSLLTNSVKSVSISAGMMSLSVPLTSGVVNNFSSSISYELDNKIIPTAVSEVYSSTVTSMKNKAIEALGTTFATSSDNGSYYVGPLNSEEFSGVGSYLDQLYNQFNDADTFISSLPTNVQPMVKSIVPEINNYISKAKSYYNDAGNVLGDIADSHDLSAGSGSNVTNNAYIDLMNNAASLASAYNYKTQYPAYSNIARDAGALMSNSDVKALPHSGAIANYLSSAISGQANSSATSMASTSTSMHGAYSEANSASISANNSLSGNEKKLENSLLGNSLNILSNAASNYYNSLAGANTDMPVDQVTVNFAGASDDPNSVTLTGFSGENFALNNSNLNIPTDDSIVSTPASFTFSGRNSTASSNAAINNDGDITVNLSASASVKDTTITIDYIENGKTVSSYTTPSSAAGTTFYAFNTINKYLPKNDEIQSYKGLTGRFANSDQTIDVYVSPESMTPTKTSSAAITIDYIENGKTVSSYTTSSESTGTSFYAFNTIYNHVPKSDEVESYNGLTNSFASSNQTIDVYVKAMSSSSSKSKPSSASSSASAGSKANSKASSQANSSSMPFIPSFNGGSSMVSESTRVSASAEPSMASSNSSSVASKARYANYVLVTKALQLHTSTNFTKKNGVAVIKPGVVLNVEKTVRARHGLVRYEVRYNNKNYFVTANKHFGIYDSYELAKPSLYLYAKVDTALQLHQSTNFTKKNGVRVAKPGMEFRINRVVKSSKGVIRYEVNYKGSVYFITANAHYVENAYLQKSNFKRGRKAVRVIKPLNEYRRANFTKRSLVRHFRRGIKLHVSRVRTIASGEVTRLQLTNGRYVSANKNFVKVIK